MSTPEPRLASAGTSGPGWTGWLGLAALVVAIDQWSKSAVTGALPDGAVVTLTSWFDLVLAYNHGAAFSVLNQGGPLPRLLFSAIAVVASVVLVLLIRSQRGQWPAQLGAALILGGALGNLADRIRLGAVVDFIQWHLGSAYWPAFNAADSAITVGAVVLVLHSLRTAKAGR